MRQQVRASVLTKVYLMLTTDSAEDPFFRMSRSRCRCSTSLRKHRHRIFRRNLDQHVGMIGHMALLNLAPFVSRQSVKHGSKFFFHHAIQLSSPILRYEDHVILALPRRVAHFLIVFHVFLVGWCIERLQHTLPMEDFCISRTLGVTPAEPGGGDWKT